jgi:hypothetical protein
MDLFIKFIGSQAKEITYWWKLGKYGFPFPKERKLLKRGLEIGSLSYTTHQLELGLGWLYFWSLEKDL